MVRHLPELEFIYNLLLSFPKTVRIEKNRHIIGCLETATLRQPQINKGTWRKMPIVKQTLSLAHAIYVCYTPKETHRLYIFTVIHDSFVIYGYIALKFCILLSYP